MGATDTIRAWVPQPLTVELRDSARVPIIGAEVVFSNSAPLPTDVDLGVSTTPNGTDSHGQSLRTDSQGRVQVYVRMGERAGVGRIIVDSPPYHDTATYTVLPGAAVGFRAVPRDTAVRAGQSYSLGLRATDRFGNQRNETPGNVTYQALDPIASVTPTGVVTAQAEGRGAIVLRSGGQSDTANLSVVPRGTLAMVNATVGHPAYRDGLYTMDVDGSNFTAVGPFLGGNDWAPQWAPDGTHLVVHGIRLIYLDGRTVVLSSPPHLAYGSTWGEYSRDGAWIYFQGEDFNVTQPAIWRMHPDGLGQEMIGPAGSEAPSPAPDGTAFAYGATRIGVKQLFVKSLTTQTPALLGQGFAPRWSPTGEWIAFLKEAPDYLEELWIVRPDGSQARRAGAGHYESGFDWSPDGKWLVAREVIIGRIVIIRVADGVVVPLVPRTIGFRQPTWR